MAFFFFIFFFSSSSFFLYLPFMTGSDPSIIWVGAGKKWSRSASRDGHCLVAGHFDTTRRVVGSIAVGCSGRMVLSRAPSRAANILGGRRLLFNDVWYFWIHSSARVFGQRNAMKRHCNLLGISSVVPRTYVRASVAWR
ncbi:hypothetical protein LX32DRAFT_121174 [Colletotrichum zoysiae]|uniref:Uncharacterized protein n=1 Tax=Colletotrichum zoysiae TaxID=1216348 RepID=A0AAD9H9F7_9PEZI|nr:hypothetical protein LX32DRAFT_121174 [Colletotrichum zoysiae]